jgi:hypothetical protein
MSTVNIETDSEFGEGQTNARFGASTRGTGPRRPSLQAVSTRPTVQAHCGDQHLPGGRYGAGSRERGFRRPAQPLGLNYAARWFGTTAPFITTNYRVWRASFGPLTDLLSAPSGTATSRAGRALKPTTKDENQVTQGVCPSPCTNHVQFPLETQQENISAFSHPTAPASGGRWLHEAGRGWIRPGRPTPSRVRRPSLGPRYRRSSIRRPASRWALWGGTSASPTISPNVPEVPDKPAGAWSIVDSQGGRDSVPTSSSPVACEV